MPLTKEQEQQLAELQAEQSRPEPRTESGLAGVLHSVLDVLAGDVAHLPAEAWAALHSQVEQTVGDQAEQQNAPDKAAASSSSSSGSKSSKS